MTRGKPRAFICAPNWSLDPFHPEHVAVGVIVVWGNGAWDYEFKTPDDQFEVLTTLEGVNFHNPEVGDYIRERLDRPGSTCFWEVPVAEGEEAIHVFERMLEAERKAEVSDRG